MKSLGLEYDIIFAGGGTAAGVIAGRLADADPSLKILILEAGPNIQHDDMHVQPGRYPVHLAPTSKGTRFYFGKRSEFTANRDIIVPTGACVGGGSSVNCVMYARPAASDYDDWDTKFSNPGWSSQQLIPLLKKVESYQLPDIANTNDSHGYSGPIKVSYGGYFTSIGKDFLAAGKSFDPNRPLVHDINSLNIGNGYSRWPKWISAGAGKRSDVAHHFIYPEEKNTNLTLLAGAIVHKVVFEGTTAVGVEFGYDPRHRPDESPECRITVNAKRLVVVSSGALGSPQLLERSGVGSKSVLSAHDIFQVVDLPGVGESYQDHQVITSHFVASEDTETLDNIMRGKPEDIQRWETLWKEEGTGLLASNTADAGCKIRPTPEELEEIGPAFQSRWKEYYEQAPDKPALGLISAAAYFGPIFAVPDQKYFAIVAYINHPTSVGSIHINSLNPLANPDFDPGLLKTEEDIAVLKFAYKHSREIARRMACYRGEFIPEHPDFGPGSAAAAVEGVKPVSPDTPKLQWSAEDDKHLEEFLRSNVQSMWHSMGTCAMKPREKGGVVDSKLNVYGTSNLKVADMSICPGNISSNTYSTALVIGEKAAVIIAEELGIQGVSAY